MVGNIERKPANHEKQIDGMQAELRDRHDVLIVQKVMCHHPSRRPAARYVNGQNPIDVARARIRQFPLHRSPAQAGRLPSPPLGSRMGRVI